MLLNALITEWKSFLRTLSPFFPPRLSTCLSFASVINFLYNVFRNGFPGGSEVKASAGNAGDPGSIPGSGRSLEKEMAIHSSTLAWRIPWREEPGRLQSTGSQRVGHD